MAKTITQLPDATVVNAADELIVQQGGVTKRATKTEVLNGIVNANIDSSAAIAGTKIAPNFGAQNVVTTGSIGAGTLFPAWKIDASSSQPELFRASSSGIDTVVYTTSSIAYAGTNTNHPFGVITNGTERLRIKSTGQVRFVPLSSDPAGAEAGDVYYNSSSNKLKVYNGSSWVDLH